MTKKLKVLITGTSQGIGKATAELFLKNNFNVIGIDIQESSITDSNYEHFQCFLKEAANFPALLKLKDISYIIHNAGIQEGNCIAVNLKDTMDLNEMLMKNNKNIKAITFNTSISGVYGDEFPDYVASKAGLNGYCKYVAKQLMPHGIANAVCFGGVLTELNAPVINNPILWKEVLKVNPLGRWMTADEAAEWIYFVTVTNKFATGQLFEVDGGENSCPRSTFVWVD